MPHVEAFRDSTGMDIIDSINCRPSTSEIVANAPAGCSATQAKTGLMNGSARQAHALSAPEGLERR